MIVLRSLTLIATALSLSMPVAARAQTFYGFAAGLNRAPAAAGESVSPGFAVQTSIGRQITQRLGVRFDSFTSRFDDRREIPATHEICIAVFPPPPGCTSSVVVKAIGVAGLSANGLINVNPPGAGIGMYLIAGGGAYYLYRHPSAAGAVRPEVSAGAGFTAPVSARSRLFVEARYYELLGAPAQPAWFVPVTFGIRF